MSHHVASANTSTTAPPAATTKGRVMESNYQTIIDCPRARSDMTPCVRRDRYAADDDRFCVGCGLGADKVADELRDLLKDALVPAPQLQGGPTDA